MGFKPLTNSGKDALALWKTGGTNLFGDIDPGNIEDMKRFYVIGKDGKPMTPFYSEELKGNKEAFEKKLQESFTVEYLSQNEIYFFAAGSTDVRKLEVLDKKEKGGLSLTHKKVSEEKKQLFAEISEKRKIEATYEKTRYEVETGIRREEHFMNMFRGAFGPQITKDYPGRKVLEFQEEGASSISPDNNIALNNLGFLTEDEYIAFNLVVMGSTEISQNFPLPDKTEKELQPNKEIMSEVSRSQMGFFIDSLGITRDKIFVKYKAAINHTREVSKNLVSKLETEDGLKKAGKVLADGLNRMTCTLRQDNIDDKRFKSSMAAIIFACNNILEMLEKHPNLKQAVFNAGLEKNIYTMLKGNRTIYQSDRKAIEAENKLLDNQPKSKEEIKKNLKDILVNSAIMEMHNKDSEKRLEKGPLKALEFATEYAARYGKPQLGPALSSAFFAKAYDAFPLTDLEKALGKNGATEIIEKSIEGDLELNGKLDQMIKDGTWKDFLKGNDRKKLGKDFADRYPFEKVFHIDVRNNEVNLKKAATVFKDTEGMLVKKTPHMVRMQKALTMALDANQKLKNNTSDTKNIEKYLVSIKNLQNAVDSYLEYKQTNMNGKTATRRAQAAHELSQFVNNTLTSTINRYYEITEKHPENHLNSAGFQLVGFLKTSDNQEKLADSKNIQAMKKKAQEHMNMFNNNKKMPGSTSLDSKELFGARVRESASYAALAVLASSNIKVWKAVEKNGPEIYAKAMSKSMTDIFKGKTAEKFLETDAKEMTNALSDKWDEIAAAANNVKDKTKNKDKEITRNNKALF